MEQIGFLFTITDVWLLWLCGWQPRAHHVPAAAEGGPGVLVDGGTHVGGGQRCWSDHLLHDHPDTLPWAACSTPMVLQ